MIKEIITALMSNVGLIAASEIILLSAIFAKIFIGVKLNVFDLKQKFDFKVLIDGIFKGFLFALSTAFFALAATGLPIIFSTAGIIEPDMASGVNVIVLVGVFAYATYKYLKEALVKYREVLGIMESEENGFYEVDGVVVNGSVDEIIAESKAEDVKPVIPESLVDGTKTMDKV